MTADIICRKWWLHNWKILRTSYFMFKTAILVLEGLVDVDLAKKLIS
jgi:hypothetical protein